ncbi:MAG: monofunctional biosynthetic peptidoglycan transglycosylase [Myxococcales bacterium]|nr:monofunctional biosynthetic peptidoglycan transglycosylase [Myxococcales bacterium]
MNQDPRWLPKEKPRRRTHRLAWFLFFAILPVAIPVVYSYLLCPFMPYYRFFNPGRTSMMDYREHQAKKKHQPFKLRYQPVPLAKIAKPLREAAVLAEDGNFYKHQGFDFEAIQKAYEYNKKRGKVVRGARTISQQVAKNLWLSPKRSWWRKLVEGILTVRLELTLPKERILEIYLNSIEWGDGIFGAKAAAEIYFHTSPDKLTASQAALLVAAIPSPLRSNPARPSGYLARRQGLILRWLSGNVADKEKEEEQMLNMPTPEPEKESPDISTPEPTPDDQAAPLLKPEKSEPPAPSKDLPPAKEAPAAPTPTPEQIAL